MRLKRKEQDRFMMRCHGDTYRVSTLSSQNCNSLACSAEQYRSSENQGIEDKKNGSRF